MDMEDVQYTRLKAEFIHFNPIRSGLFQTVNDPGGGGGL